MEQHDGRDGTPVNSFVLFKGATRPPEKFNMPLLPFVLLLGGTVASFFVFQSFYVFLIFIVGLPILYYFGKKDPKFITQVILKVKFAKGNVGELFCKEGATYEPNRPMVDPLE